MTLRRPFISAVIVALAVMIVATACGDDAGTPSTAGVASTTAAGGVTTTAGGDGDTTTTTAPREDEPANPTSIDVTLDSGSAVTETIGLAGGTVATTGGDGTVYTLTVPEGALIDDVAITIVPLAGAEGAPIGESPILGVTLEPAGLHFLGAATLEIAGDGVPADGVAFAAGSDGENFHLVPSTSGDGTATVPVAHFSAYGLGGQQVEEIANSGDYAPSGSATRAPHWLTLERAGLFWGEIRLWTQNLLDRLSGSPDTETLESVTVELVRLYELLGREATEELTHPDSDELRARARTLLLIWVENVATEVDRLAGFCSQNEIAAGFDIARWWMIGVFVTGGAAPDITNEWVDQARACFTFDVTWTAEVVNTGDGIETPVSTELQGTVPPAQGPGSQNSSEYVLSLVQGGETTAATTGPVNVSGGPFGLCTGAADGAAIALIIETDIPNLGDVGTTFIERMWGVVALRTPLQVECPELLGVAAPVLETFFVGPLIRVNEDRVYDGLLAEGVPSIEWRFGLDRPADPFIAYISHEDQLGGSPSTFTISQEIRVLRAPPS